MVFSNPLVSCVCLTYGRSELLNELLFCFINQNYSNKELLIVNDQSDIEYYYNNPNVRIFNLKKRFNSLGEKRNFTRDKIKGDFVFIMDDDDIYHSNHILKHVWFHEQFLEYDIVFNKRKYFSEKNGIIVMNNLNIPFNGACIKSEYYKTHEFPNINCGEDIKFIVDAKICALPDDDPTFHYRIGQSTHNISKNDTLCNEIIINSKTSRLIKLNPDLKYNTKLHYK